MVYLTVTPAILEAIEYLDGCGSDLRWNDGEEQLTRTSPRVGLPISHFKVVEISRCIRTSADDQSNEPAPAPPLHRIDDLLRGSRVYDEPPKPKAEPVSGHTQHVHD